jgi:hypothetical protein
MTHAGASLYAATLKDCGKGGARYPPAGDICAARPRPSQPLLAEPPPHQAGRVSAEFKAPGDGGWASSRARVAVGKRKKRLQLARGRDTRRVFKEPSATRRPGNLPGPIAGGWCTPAAEKWIAGQREDTSAGPRRGPPAVTAAAPGIASCDGEVTACESGGGGAPGISGQFGAVFIFPEKGR